MDLDYIFDDLDGFIDDAIDTLVEYSDIDKCRRLYEESGIDALEENVRGDIEDMIATYVFNKGLDAGQILRAFNQDRKWLNDKLKIETGITFNEAVQLLDKTDSKSESLIEDVIDALHDILLRALIDGLYAPDDTFLVDEIADMYSRRMLDMIGVN